jgi:hypothetical protein
MLFNKQNKRPVDARYFLKESLLNEAPSAKQVSKLKTAIEKVFGANSIMGQGSEGHSSYVTIKDQEGNFHNFTPVSGRHEKRDIQPSSFRKAGEGPEQIAYILLQNAEQMERVMMPVIKKIYDMAGEKLGKEDKEFSTTDVSSSPLDQQSELAKLKREHEQLKRDFDQLKAMVLKMMGGEASEAPTSRSLSKIPTPARSAASRSTGPSLEIDE